MKSKCTYNGAEKKCLQWLMTSKTDIFKFKEAKLKYFHLMINRRINTSQGVLLD